MRDLSSVNVPWLKNDPMAMFGIKTALIKLSSGVQAHIVVGKNEEGWEHVSIELMARRLPTWDEMCYVKDLFWDEEEEVIQIHPKKSHYVNLTEALHLWRPINGDWSIMNEKEVF